eukprot:5917633-Amphidinium_carterae.1
MKYIKKPLPQGTRVQQQLAISCCRQGGHCGAQDDVNHLKRGKLEHVRGKGGEEELRCGREGRLLPCLIPLASMRPHSQTFLRLQFIFQMQPSISSRDGTVADCPILLCLLGRKAFTTSLRSQTL